MNQNKKIKHLAKFMTFSLPSVFLLYSKLFKVRLAIPVLLVVF